MEEKIKQITFNELPEAVSQLSQKLDNIERLLQSQQSQPQDEWMDLDALTQYDPEKRTKTTFYGYVSRREIPFHKKGKKLTFLKSEIDEWIKTGRKKTSSEIESEAHTYLKQSR